MKICVTGANGFIGSHLCRHLEAGAYSLKKVVRSAQDPEIKADTIVVGDISKTTDWSTALEGIDVVVHVAGLAHVKDATYEVFHAVNVSATERLAWEAIRHRVRRFVYVSTIGVHGDFTPRGTIITEDLSPTPQRDYAKAKWESEQRLMALADQIEVVSVRPPLVYGSHAKGNFARLMKLVQKGIPLPFGSINNRRSFVGIDNLVNFLERCITHPRAASNAFVICDERPISTTELITIMCDVMKTKTVLFPVPERVIKTLSALSGQRELFYQLWGNLEIDAHKARTLLDWQPRISVEAGIRAAVQNETDSALK